MPCFYTFDYLYNACSIIYWLVLLFFSFLCLYFIFIFFIADGLLVFSELKFFLFRLVLVFLW